MNHSKSLIKGDPKQNWKHLQETVQDILQQAKAMGADSAEAGISFTTGLSTSVRMGETETIEFNHDTALGITVYKEKRKGSVSTTDIHKDAIRSTLEAAVRIASYTEDDPCSGLADPEMLAHNIPDLDLYHPWKISPEEAVLWAKECEAGALNFDAKISNSEGASFSTHSHYRVYGNTNDFLAAYPTTKYSLSCCVIAKENDFMQRDSDFTIARSEQDLEARVGIGQKAALKALRRLNAKKMKTCDAPVIFHAEIASSLLGHLLGAISGSNLYRKSSFLLDHLGKSIFPDFVDIEEVPHMRKGLASAPFDAEGVETQQHDIIREGVLQSYILGSYSARKLGLKTTGNAGGIHNVIVSHADIDLVELLQEMNTGLLVTELLGHGVNLLTGDYSRGAAGFWVENGEIQYPVHEITIAGNLKNMFQNLVAIGNDIEKRSSILTGSIWIDNMTIAGA